MRNRFFGVWVVALMTMATQLLVADGTIIKIQKDLVLIDTDKGVGSIGDVVPVYRLTTSGWQKVGEIQLIKFAKGKAAGRIVRQNKKNPITIDDVVKPEPPPAAAPSSTEAVPVRVSPTFTGTPALAIGLGLPYVSIKGDFDGKKIARPTGNVEGDAPFFVPSLTRQAGVMGWVQFGLPESIRPLSAVRVGYQYSQHEGRWEGPDSLFYRLYLGRSDRGSGDGITLHCHRLSLGLMFDLLNGGPFRVRPNLGMNWEFLRMNRAVIDHVVTDPYADETPPFVTAVMGDRTEWIYRETTQHNWLYNVMMGVELGLDVAYYLAYEFSLEAGLRYNVYNDVLPVGGKVYTENGETNSRLMTNTLTIFAGISYGLDLYKLLK